MMTIGHRREEFGIGNLDFGESKSISHFDFRNKAQTGELIPTSYLLILIPGIRIRYHLSVVLYN